MASAEYVLYSNIQSIVYSHIWHAAYNIASTENYKF